MHFVTKKGSVPKKDPEPDSSKLNPDHAEDHSYPHLANRGMSDEHAAKAWEKTGMKIPEHAGQHHHPDMEDDQLVMEQAKISKH